LPHKAINSIGGNEMSRLGTVQTPRTRAEVVNAFMRGVYNWMSIGLLVTAAVAYMIYTLPAFQSIFFSVNPATGMVGPSIFFWGAIIAEFGLVLYLSARIQHMSAQTATTTFIIYSALNGATLSLILMAYTASSIFNTFIVTAGMFAALSFYGLTTKRDLTGMGSFLMMGLFGIIIASIVNFFMHSSAMEFVISIIGVVIFAGLTAYDSQKLQAMGENAPMDDQVAIRRGTILGALSLYLDFINLFLFLIRFMGVTRD
jgi:hypothetical protein